MIRSNTFVFKELIRLNVKLAGHRNLNTLLVVCCCISFLFFVRHFVHKSGHKFSLFELFCICHLNFEFDCPFGIFRPSFIAFYSVWAKAQCWRPYIDLLWFTFINCYLDGELSHWHSHHIFLYLFTHKLVGDNTV